MRKPASGKSTVEIRHSAVGDMVRGGKLPDGTQPEERAFGLRTAGPTAPSRQRLNQALRPSGRYRPKAGNRRTPPPLTAAQGFTLIEIMLVIAIAGILALVTIPKYNAVTNYYHLQTSAQAVEGNLRYAKQLAMDRRRNVALVFSPGSIQLDELSVDAGGNVTAVQPLSPPQPLDGGVLVSDSSGLSTSQFLPGLSYVYFNNQGFLSAAPDASAATPITVTLIREGASLTVKMLPETGGVSLAP